MDEPERRTPEMEERVAEAMRAAAERVERDADCRCGVVGILEAEARAFFKIAEEEAGIATEFFTLQGKYLQHLAQRFRDDLQFVQQMKTALEQTGP